jgi:hypothetical protein
MQEKCKRFRRIVRKLLEQKIAAGELYTVGDVIAEYEVLRNHFGHCPNCQTWAKCYGHDPDG